MLGIDEYPQRRGCPHCASIWPQEHCTMCPLAPRGVDHNGHAFYVPPRDKSLEEMTLAEIDDAVCTNYHLNEELPEKDKILLRAALGLPKGGVDG